MSEEIQMALTDGQVIAQQAEEIARLKTQITLLNQSAAEADAIHVRRRTELEGTIIDLTATSTPLIAELECELTAARAVNAYANDYLKQSGRCFFCGFGRKLSGEEFHGTGCLLHVYNQVIAKGTHNAD